MIFASLNEHACEAARYKSRIESDCLPAVVELETGENFMKYLCIYTVRLSRENRTVLAKPKVWEHTARA
jgi:hypothetical protein